MESIVGVMKKIAEQEVQKIYTTELGVVTAIFPHADKGDKDNYQCSITLKNYKQPDGKDFELRKVSIAIPHLGWANIPNIGDLVLVSFISGDLNNPVIIGRLYNDEERPPVNQEKEFLLQHPLQEGSSLKMDAEGTITWTHKDTKTTVVIQEKKVISATEKASIALEEPNITLKNEKATISITDGDISIKSEKCQVSLSGTTVLIDNGTCKIEIAGGGITLDAGSNNITLKSMGNIKVGDATTGGVAVGGRMTANAVGDNDDIILSSHTHLGNLGAPCPVLIPMEKINSIQAKARNTKVG